MTARCSHARGRKWPGRAIQWEKEVLGDFEMEEMGLMSFMLVDMNSDESPSTLSLPRVGFSVFLCGENNAALVSGMEICRDRRH